MNLSIIIPCYNESENIPLILSRFAEAIADKPIEVVLVNNGSTDDTPAVLDSLLPRYPFARTVLVEKNQGYGYGILSGLRTADSDFLGWTHADMQTDPADVVRAFSLVESVPDPSRLYVKGSRTGRPLADNFFTAGMSVFETIYLGRVMCEINAQPNIFPRRFFLAWKNPPYDFALDLYALYMAKAHHLDIRRIPVAFPERVHGASKWNTGLASKWKFIKRTIEFSRKLKREGIE